MSLGAYLLGSVTVLLLGGGAALLGSGLRRHLLPGWSGAPAALAAAVLALAPVVVALELVGAVGLLRRPALLALAGAAGAGGWLLRRRAGRHGPGAGEAGPTPPQAVPRWQRLVAFGAGGLVVGLWAGQVAWTLGHGVVDYDTIDYHLPIALEWYQTGRVGPLVLTTPDLAVPTYPYGSELLHAAGMVAYDRDVLSPFLNLAWLALLLLAGWVSGLRWQVPGVSLAAAAVVAGLPQVAHLEAGTALSDVPALACLLAGVALLLAAPPGAGRPVALVAGIAFGLAVGSKLTVAPAVAAVSLAVLVAHRRRGVVLVGGALLAGGFWYARNWLLAGSPLPALHLPVLPRPEYALFEQWQQSVSDYLGDDEVVRTFFTPALRQLWGPLWPVTVLLSVGGAALAVAAGRTWVVRGLGVLALVTSAGYLVMPHAAGGPDRFPFLFGGNLRFALPALLFGLLALVAAAARWRFGPPLVAAAFVVPLASAAVASWSVVGLPYPRHLATGLAGLALALVLGLALDRAPVRAGGGPAGRRGRLVAGLAATLLVVTAAFPVFRWYLDERYAARDPGLRTAYALFRDVEDARVAVAGVGAKYPYAGPDLSNEVDYVGRRLPYGGFTEAADCREWRQLLRDGRYDYVVVAPSPIGPPVPPQRAWTAGDPAARLVLDSDGVAVFRLDGPPRPALC